VLRSALTRATYHATTIARHIAIDALMRYALLRQNTPTEEQQQYVPKGKRSRWIVGIPFARIGTLIDRAADLLLTIKWTRGTESSKRYRAVRAIARRMATGNGRKVTSVAAAMALVAVIVMESRAAPKRNNEATFDTDSSLIGVDNRCSACISDNPAHFVGKLTPGLKTIKGFHGSRTTEIMMGTIRWKWLDQEGLEHVFDIPESYYVPEGKCCLLSPQHWAKAHKKATGWRVWETTDADTCTLFWLGGDKRLVIPISVSDNVATFPLAPGYEKFTAFCAEAQIEDSDDRDPIIAQPAVATGSDDEGDDEPYEDDDDWQSLVPEREKDDDAMVSTEVQEQSNQCVPCEEEPTTTDFSLNGTTEGEKLPEVDIMEEDTQPTNLAAELLRIHHRMGHAPFAKLQEMAKQGALPGRLKNCPIPTCTACMYGKASRQKWRDKPTSRVSCKREKGCQSTRWYRRSRG
jgi:hypothetical protein